MIKIRRVSKTYKGDSFTTLALDDVSFEIKDGEFLVIKGVSGSGKSTLLKIIGGMSDADAGEIYYDDTDILKLPPKQLDVFRKNNISFIFQHFALMDKYTVYENLEAPLLARNVKKKERKNKIENIAAILDIKDILFKTPVQISGGQRQRTAIGRALIVDSEIILADEPTGALDKENTERVMDILNNINKKGKTIVVITHDDFVASYADRVIMLSDGKMEKYL